ETYEAERNRAETLADLDRAKTEFFANISHELRTPLTLLVAPLDRLRRQPAGTYSPEVTWQLDAMHRNVGVLIRHIEGLLNLIRMDEGQLQVNRKPMYLRPLLESLISRFGPHAHDQGVRLEVTGPDATVLGDSERLDTVFSNLLSNALKFTEKGGRIGFDLTRNGDRVEIAASDTGRGIPLAEQQSIFERFVQGQNAGGRGLGLGLSLVKEILSLHGGTIGVSSVLGEGSTFRVTLPVAPAEPDATAAPAESRMSAEVPELVPLAAPSESVPSGAERVLVIEDQEDLRNFLAVCLRERFSVFSAATGEQGLAMAEQIAPDVIVCDLRLPDRTGLELTRALRSRRATADIPIILMTAFETPELRVDGLRQGAVDFLGKPFSPAELIARIDVQLRLRRLAADSAHSQKLAMLQTLLEGLAHEVRNPLNVIANTAPLLRKKLRQDDDHLVALVEEASARIGLLVDDLTALSRSDGETRWTDWSPSSSVDGTLRLLEARCTNIAVTKVLGFGGKVRGRGVQLDQIVMNLIDNAIRAMPKGGTLEVRVDTREQALELSVRDSGVGIPAGMVPRIFDPFFTTRETGEGTGLGLHISRRIAEAHGGRIEVTSEPGKGSCFTLLLPLQGEERAG
ncbi:MAG: ATP-binding protein, partial [Myxococcaceae bacterium]